MIKRSCLCGALLLALAAMAPALAQPEGRHAVTIEAQDLEAALKLLAQQTRLQIVYPAGLVQGKQAAALDGSMTATQALERLLRGSGLKYEFLDPQTVTVSPIRQAPAGPSSGSETMARDLEAVTVTGTRIRGGATPSPVITIGAEHIRQEGFRDLGSVIRSIPQNFSGGQNPEVPVVNMLGGGLANQNVTGGSGLNLRGLGPDATLTLLNGRRMAYTGFSQAVDISAIPVEAVERIEIVADGASAIYGSDAVGGVGNVIIKRDFEGVSLGMRYGAATSGGLDTREYTATAGSAWNGGGVIASLKHGSTDPVFADERRYTAYLPGPRTLLPASDLRSGLVSAYQRLGDYVELKLDALRSDRDQETFFVINSPPHYGHVTPDTTSTVLSPSIDVLLPNDWLMTVGGVWGEDEHHNVQSNLDIATGTSTLLYDECMCNKSVSYEIGAEGPLFTLSGGQARLAIGIGQRENEFLYFNHRTATTTFGGEDGSRFGYAELNLPVVGEGSDVSGVDRLEFTAAVRMEDYDSLGSVTTPKLGLVYAPGASFTARASWGKSFKAPTLFQKHRSRYAALDPPDYYGGTGYGPGAAVLATGGGDPDLAPERAKTHTVSLAFHPEGVPGLETELSWFRIDYTDRVIEPIPNWNQALSNPIFAPFVDFDPSPELQAAAIASADNFWNYTGAPHDPSTVVALVRFGYANVSRQEIRGVDLSGSYGFDLGPGRLTVRGSATWLESSQQTTPEEDAFDLAGTLFNPPKVSGRLGAVWTRDRFTAAGFASYRGGVTNSVTGEKPGSFTTFDTTLSYATARREGALSGIEFALSAQNLFDREPPLYTPESLIHSTPYDPTNYSAIGRFVSLSVSKHF